MAFQLNLAVIAVAGQAAWKRAKPMVVQDVVLLPLAGFGDYFTVVGCCLPPTMNAHPPEALVANLDTF